MKELRSVTANYAMVLNPEGEAKTAVEVVLLVSEPRYSIDGAGTLTSARNLEDLRFTTSPKALRDMAASMCKMADEADEAARAALAGGERC